MKSGKMMPCNWNMIPFWERPGAKGKIITESGKVISCDLSGPRDTVTGFGYVSHFATCPHAARHRRR
jgi:hypothetical protein